VADDWNADNGFLDINADGYISAVDPLMVINHLNTEGEGESPRIATTDCSDLLAALAADTVRQSVRRRAAIHQT
jgi:hypothetical protein